LAPQPLGELMDTGKDDMGKRLTSSSALFAPRMARRRSLSPPPSFENASRISRSEGGKPVGWDDDEGAGPGPGAVVGERGPLRLGVGAGRQNMMSTRMEMKAG
jgi:hypothetical protein